MKLKCDDGIIRRFKPAEYTGELIKGFDGSSICLECGESFDVHDTKVLKPLWKKHHCIEG